MSTWLILIQKYKYLYFTTSKPINPNQFQSIVFKIKYNNVNAWVIVKLNRATLTFHWVCFSTQNLLKPTSLDGDRNSSNNWSASSSCAIGSGLAVLSSNSRILTEENSLGIWGTCSICSKVSVVSSIPTLKTK